MSFKQGDCGVGTAVGNSMEQLEQTEEGRA